MNLKRRRLIVKLVSILTILVFYYEYKLTIDYKYSFLISWIQSFKNTDKVINSYYEQNKKLTIKPYCKQCQKELTLFRRDSDNSLVSHESNFIINQKHFSRSRFTCGLYNVIKKGGRLEKVVSYSFYGNNPKYSNYLEILVQQVRDKYPGFTARIYYDETQMVNKTLRCYLECKYSYLIEFCDVSRFYNSLEEMLLIRSGEQLFSNLNYIHKMMWRFLPIGDDFVDVFMSRDTDSLIIDREVSAVEQWISDSDKIAHIMRDHEGHLTEILGGMWGFKPEMDRSLSRYLYSLIMTKSLAKYYNRKEESPKVSDQVFLTDYVYPFVVNRATIHDSYYCRLYSNSKPFPSKRVGFAFVGNSFANQTNTKECPIECRPNDHIDWIHC